MPKETIETLVTELIHEEDWRRMRATTSRNDASIGAMSGEWKA